MVTTGFSKPYVAKYSNVGAKVTYAEGLLLGRGVSVEIEPNTTEDNNFYVDNEVGETEGAQFISGKATIEVDGLEPDSAKLVLGLAETFETGDEQKTTLQGYGDINPPYVGYGCVRRTQMKGVVKYWPIIYPKMKFSIPKDAAATQEEQIDWQTQELSGTIVRDDTEKRHWKVTSPTGFDTEEEAEAVVKKFLNITDVMAARTMSKVGGSK